MVVSSEVVEGQVALRRALGRLGTTPPDVVYLSLDGEARTCATIAREAADTQGLADTAVLVSAGAPMPRTPPCRATRCSTARTWSRPI